MSDLEKKPLPKVYQVGDQVEVLVLTGQNLPNEWWPGEVVPNNRTSRIVPENGIVVEIDAEKPYLVIVNSHQIINRINI